MKYFIPVAYGVIFVTTFYVFFNPKIEIKQVDRIVVQTKIVYEPLVGECDKFGGQYHNKTKEQEAKRNDELKNKKFEDEELYLYQRETPVCIKNGDEYIWNELTEKFMRNLGVEELK